MKKMEYNRKKIWNKMELQPYRLEDFEFVKEIGKGGFATVYEATCHKPGKWGNKNVAIKKINKKSSKDHNKNKMMLKRVEEEIYIHKNVDHPNIVKYYTEFEDEDFKYLVLELCLENLEQFLNKEKQILEVIVVDIIQQIVEGLIYLHDRNIIHRDLSLRNILITQTSPKQVKIADFGLATCLTYQNEMKQSMLGTPNYQSPEMHNHEKYDFKVDSWSLGCIVFALFCGKLPFDKKHVQDVRKATLTEAIQEKIPQHVSSLARELIEKLLNKHQTQRMRIKDIKESPLFKNYDKLTGNYRSRADSAFQSKSSSNSNKYNTKGSSFKDSGNQNTFSTSALKYIHQSSNCFDSGLDSSPDHEFKRHNSLLKTNPSSVDSSKNSIKTKHTNGYMSQKSIKCYEGPKILKDRYPVAILEEIDEEDQQSLSPVFVASCDKRERSASEEQRKNRRMQTYSRVETHSSHRTRDRSKAQKNIENNYHALPQRCKSNSSESHHRKRIPIENFYSESDNYKYLTPKPLKLSTGRLKPKRYPLKGKVTVVSILENKEVCVERIKTKGKKQYVSCVMRISADGEWTYFYKPQNFLVGPSPPPKPSNADSIESFPYDDLPERHFKMYRHAQMIVEMLRSSLVNIIIYDEDAKFVMMENYPDPNCHMEFFSGGSVVRKSKKVTLTDKRGRTVIFTQVKTLEKSFQVMYEKFLEMLKCCETLERWMKLNETLANKLTYPVHFGNPPEKKPLSEKENYCPTENSYCLSKIEAICMKLKSKPKIVNGEVYIEYKNGYTVQCSRNEEIIKIKDFNRKCIYDSQFKHRVDSEQRASINKILQDLPSLVSVAVSRDLERSGR